MPTLCGGDVEAFTWGDLSHRGHVTGRIDGTCCPCSAPGAGINGYQPRSESLVST
jgi:hypothetical protein